MFSNTPFTYDGEAVTVGAPSSVVAPGMAARFAVRFAPNTLNDQTDDLHVHSFLWVDTTSPTMLAVKVLVHVQLTCFWHGLSESESKSCRETNSHDIRNMDKVSLSPFLVSFAAKGSIRLHVFLRAYMLPPKHRRVSPTKTCLAALLFA